MVTVFCLLVIINRNAVDQDLKRYSGLWTYYWYDSSPDKNQGFFYEIIYKLVI